MFDRSGHRALLTGSSTGIGSRVGARGLAGAGAEGVLNGRDEAPLVEGLSRLRDAGANVRARPFGVTSPEAVGAAAQIKREFATGPSLLAIPAYQSS